MDCWEQKDNSHYDDNRLALVSDCFKGFCEQNIESKPQIDEPPSAE